MNTTTAAARITAHASAACSSCALAFLSLIPQPGRLDPDVAPLVARAHWSSDPARVAEEASKALRSRP